MHYLFTFNIKRLIVYVLTAAVEFIVNTHKRKAFLQSII